MENLITTTTRTITTKMLVALGNPFPGPIKCQDCKHTQVVHSEELRILASC